MHLHAEGPNELDGVFRDTLKQVIFQKDPATGAPVNVAPLVRTRDGPYRNLYPVHSIWVDVDGAPFDHDRRPVANRLQKFIARRAVVNTASAAGHEPSPSPAIPLSFVELFDDLSVVTDAWTAEGHVPVARISGNASSVDDFHALYGDVPQFGVTHGTFRNSSFCSAVQGADVT